MPQKKSNKHTRELERLKKEVAIIQQRLNVLKAEGVNVEAINAALAKLSTDVDALIAKGSGGITPAQAKTIVDGLTALSTKIEAAVAA